LQSTDFQVYMKLIRIEYKRIQQLTLNIINCLQPNKRIKFSTKPILILLILNMCIVQQAKATHIIGGDLTAQMVDTNLYVFKIRLFRDDVNGGPSINNSTKVGVYEKGTHTLVTFEYLSRDTTYIVPIGDPCFTPDTNVFRVEEGIYTSDTVYLPDYAPGYYLHYHTWQRNNMSLNLLNPLGFGFSFYAQIPDPAIGQNSTPDFGEYPLDAYLCVNTPQTKNFSATDIDGDSLVYSLEDPLGSIAQGSNSTSFPGSGAYPFYPAVPWNTADGFNLSNICGGPFPMSINPNTGVITAQPDLMGYYTFAVRVEEYRNGIKIGEVRRDVQYASMACPTYFVDLPDATLCGDNPLILDATSTSSTYLWQDGSTNSTLNVTQQGTYWVEVTNQCGVVTDTITVDSISSPIIDLGNDTLLCPGEQLFIDASINGSTYLWQDNSTSGNYSITQPGIYFVEVNSICGVTEDTIEVTYYNSISSTLSDTTICEGSTQLLVASTSPDYSYLWQDGSTASTYNVTQEGTYWVNITNHCGTLSDTAVITTVSAENVNLGNDTTLCPGDSLYLELQYPNCTYLWQDYSTNNNLTILQSGIYFVQLSNTCGITADTIEIQYHPSLTIDLGNDTTLCIGQEMILNAESPEANSYNWQNNSTNSTYTVSEEGTYSVIVENQCTTLTDSVAVSYITLPELNLGPDMTLCDGENVHLNVTLPNVTYLWQDLSTEPTLTASSPGEYWVELHHICGTLTDSITLDFEDCYCPTYVPNTFTPNDDGANETFGPVSQCEYTNYEFLIFDRWGHIVFESDDINTMWAGDVQIGVYVWKLKARTIFGEYINQIGHVSVVR